MPKDTSKEQISAVDLTCNGTMPWHAFLPVEVTINTKVLVARHMILQNETISDDDLDFSLTNKSRLYNGYYQNKDEISGRIAAQVITEGTIITKKNTQLPVLVHRNQSIDIIAQSHAVIVSMKGIAQSDGSLHQAVKVYNPSSKRTLDAIVVGLNKAEAIS